MTELLALRAVVEAPPDTVAGVLLDVRPGGRSPLAVGGTATGDEDAGFTVVRDGSPFTVVVDRAARSVTEQSEWWFRAVTSVEPDPRGSLVTHRVCNVAPGHLWAVRFVSRGPLAAAPATFAAHVAALGRALGAAARVLD